MIHLLVYSLVYHGHFFASCHYQSVHPTIRDGQNSSNTAITDSGRPIIAAPFSFIVEAASGQANWKSTFKRLKHSEVEATWQAQSKADGIEVDLTGRLDYTGSGEIDIKLTAQRDMDIKDIRLDIPWVEDSAVYFMGLNRPGGRRPSEPVSWKWDLSKQQNCFWLGDVNAGMMLRLKDEAFVRPLVNIYYHFLQLNLPKSWGNDDKGGIKIAKAANGIVPVSAYGGARNLKAGDQLHFITEFYITPFRKIDTEKQWAVRFLHPQRSSNKDYMRNIVDGMDRDKGANALNIHHANGAYPYINYPYADDTVSELKYLLEKTHDKGIQTRTYYTTREITNNFPELHALHSMNGEVIFPGLGKDARTYINRNGPHKWLIDNLGDKFLPAWVDGINLPHAKWDLSVITQPDSRWDNYYRDISAT